MGKTTIFYMLLVQNTLELLKHTLLCTSACASTPAGMQFESPKMHALLEEVWLWSCQCMSFIYCAWALMTLQPCPSTTASDIFAWALESILAHVNCFDFCTCVRACVCVMRHLDAHPCVSWHLGTLAVCLYHVCLAITGVMDTPDGLF